MRFPVRPLQGRLPGGVERRTARFVWPDPRVILDEHVTPDQFRVAMDAIEVGGTVKITKADRHPKADALLLDLAATRGSDFSVVDIGASDGSTSVDLIAKLPAFGRYVIADLFLSLEAVTDHGRDFFFDHDGTCVLIVGSRFVAWPTRSDLVARLSARAVARARSRWDERRPVSLLNPATRAVLADDPRVSAVTHDVFVPWPAERSGGTPPDVIKVANVLGPYFGDDRIAAAADALFAGLVEGGHLLLVDNGTVTGAEPRAGLYRRTGDRFERVGRTTTLPQLDVLVDGVARRPVTPAAAPRSAPPATGT